MLRRVALTVMLPGTVLLLFGLRALEQDRLAVEHQIRTRLENTSELAARSIDQQLSNWHQFRDAGVLLTGEPLRPVPPDRLAYTIDEIAPLAERDPAFAEAEKQELAGNWDRAVALYREAAREVPGIRTQASLRVAEIYRKSGWLDLAAGEYHSVLQKPDERAGALSSHLIARFQLCMIGKGDRAAFYHDLVSGRWRDEQRPYAVPRAKHLDANGETAMPMVALHATRAGLGPGVSRRLGRYHRLRTIRRGWMGGRDRVNADLQKPEPEITATGPETASRRRTGTRAWLKLS